MNLTYAYIFLFLAIAFEVLSTSFLKDTNGFTNLYPSLIVIANIFELISTSSLKDTYGFTRLNPSTIVAILGICLYFMAAIIVMPTMPPPAQLA